MTQEIKDIVSLDWETKEFPENFQVLDAIILVKGVYVDEDGDVSRPCWAHRWTNALTANINERIGVLRVAGKLMERDAMAEFHEEGDCPND